MTSCGNKTFRGIYFVPVCMQEAPNFSVSAVMQLKVSRRSVRFVVKQRAERPTWRSTLHCRNRQLVARAVRSHGKQNQQLNRGMASSTNNVVCNNQLFDDQKQTCALEGCLVLDPFSLASIVRRTPIKRACSREMLTQL